LGPILAVSLSAPFVIAGVLKSVYDAGLYALFRNVEFAARRRAINSEGRGPDPPPSGTAPSSNRIPGEKNGEGSDRGVP
jgi:hypothetical protein